MAQNYFKAFSHFWTSVRTFALDCFIVSVYVHYYLYNKVSFDFLVTTSEKNLKNASTSSCIIL